MRIGLAYALAEPVVRSTLVRSAAFFGCASAIWALLPLYVRQVLGSASTLRTVKPWLRRAPTTPARSRPA